MAATHDTVKQYVDIATRYLDPSRVVSMVREMRDVPVKSASVRTTMERLVEEAEKRAAAGEDQ